MATIITCLFLFIYQVVLRRDNSFSLLQTTRSNGGLISTIPKKRIVTYHELKRNGWDMAMHGHTKGTAKTIPKLLFRTAPYPLHNVPKEIQYILNATITKNQEYLLIYFDDNDAKAFVHDHYPQYESILAKLNTGAYRADVLRLLIVYHYGGMYNDIGHSYLVPLREVISEGDEFISAVEQDDRCECNVHNALLGSYPKHPLLLHIIKSVCGGPSSHPFIHPYPFTQLFIHPYNSCTPKYTHLRSPDI